MIKKFTALFCAAIMVFALAIPGFAYYVGQPIDSVLSTDIVAYINNVPIRSYNIQGNTVVVAEDLADYGFDVTWNGVDKTLSVVRNTAKSVKGNGWKPVTTLEAPIGSKVMDVLYTDIVTYLGGKPIQGYNIDGATAIMMDELASYGASYVYDNSTRTLKLVLAGVAPTTPTDPIPTLPAEPEKPLPTEPDFDSLFEALSSAEWGASKSDIKKLAGDNDFLVDEANTYLMYYYEELYTYLTISFDARGLCSIKFDQSEAFSGINQFVTAFMLYYNIFGESFGAPTAYNIYAYDASSKLALSTEQEILSAIESGKAEMRAIFESDDTQIVVTLGSSFNQLMLTINLLPATLQN